MRKPRLNFTLTVATLDLLGTYCIQTGRTQSGVIRQLVCEWVEATREIPDGPLEHPAGPRSNVQLARAVLSALEARVVKWGGGTTSAAIEALLAAFLAHRVQSLDAVTVQVVIPTEIYNNLHFVCESLGISVTEALLMDATKRAALVGDVLEKAKVG